MFSDIKNKFRFFTVSFLLASLVTVVSSASAEETPNPCLGEGGDGDCDLGFDVQVTSCTDGDVPAFWEPSIDVGSTSISVAAGGTGDVVVLTGLTDGYLGCDDERGDVTGFIDSTFIINNPDPTKDLLDVSRLTTPSCAVPSCNARTSSGPLPSLTWTFYLDPLAESGNYNGDITLTWTPGGP